MAWLQPCCGRRDYVDWCTVRDYVMARDGSLSEASAAILANHSSRIRSLVHRQGVAVMVCPYLPWLGRSIDHRRERERKYGMNSSRLFFILVL